MDEEGEYEGEEEEGGRRRSSLAPQLLVLPPPQRVPTPGYCEWCNKERGTSGCSHPLETLISIFLDRYPEVGLLDHTAILFLICPWRQHHLACLMTMFWPPPPRQRLSFLFRVVLARGAGHLFIFVGTHQ